MPGSVSPNILLAAVRIVVIVAMLVFESSVFLDSEYSFSPSSTLNAELQTSNNADP